MNLKSITNSEDCDLNNPKVQKIVACTFVNSKSCIEIFEVIKERLYYKSKSIDVVLKVS